MQIGGPSGQRVASISATPTNGGNGIVGLTPVNNYVSYYINIPADHVWVGCKNSDFYEIDASNNSGNQITGTEKDPTGLIFGIGIGLEDGQQNSVNFVCVHR